MTDHLPTGTVTFLFTDIEDSTRLWQEQPEAMSAAHAQHDTILREAIEANHGYIFQIVGDSFSAAFSNALDALRAVVKAQHALHQPSEGMMIRVRMGLHTGAAELITGARNKTYNGYVTLASTQRVMSAAHGGQVLLSQTTRDLLQNSLPENASLRDVGEHRLKSLRTTLRLYQLVAPDLPSNFPPLQSLETTPNNLPTQLTTFIGREKELVEISTLLQSARLVTLTGSGGTGKTRLAQEAGAHDLANFPQGAWLIELAALTDGSQILPAMAQVFGLQELPFIPLATLVTDYLRDKKLLLILDNCEHLIEACARLADDLLHQSPGLRILASSREALGIAGESVYHTPSLADSESTQLFVDRARAVNPNFTLSAGNAAAISQICTRLDGIPLAIELAAARVKLLSAEQIAARLDDRFRLLVGGSRTALPRQQTLRALIDWSYDLLSDEEKRLLQFASVFGGGWTLDALESVADDPHTIEDLEQLVNKSMVVTEEREGEMRYFMLETIRQYAREKLFDAQLSPVARDRHFFYFAGLSEWMWETIRSANALPMVSSLVAEVENFRAALEWGLANQVDETVRLAANYCLTSNLHGNLAEGVDFVKTALERVSALPPVEGEAYIRRQKIIARALYAQGVVGLSMGNITTVQQELKKAIAISRMTGDKQMLGYCLGMYFVTSAFVYAPDAEDSKYEALRIFSEEVDDPFGLGMAYMVMARIAARQGNESERQMYLEKVSQMSREMPGSFQFGLFFQGMGMDERIRGNFASGKLLLEKALEYFNRFRNSNFRLVINSELGHVERQSGNLAQAKSIYRETIQGWQNLGNRAAIAHQLECFGFLANEENDPRRAVKLFGAAEALRKSIQSQMTDPERVEYDQAVASMGASLPGDEFLALWTEGRSMMMDEAIQFALGSEPGQRGKSG